MKTLKDIDLKNKTVLIRADLNVPLDKSLNITDDNRIREILPTVQYALQANARVILCSHLGRPKGKVSAEFSLAPVARRLSELLQKEVPLAPDCLGPEVQKMVQGMKPGDLLLLENLRFHPEEEKNDENFGRALAELADVYINDAFAVSHRSQASVVAVTLFAKACAAGFLLERELNFFNQSMENPARPLVAVIGGAKVSSKLAVLENLMENVDKMIIGGAMANTFLKSQGIDTGKSLIENDLVLTAASLMEKAKTKGVKFYLPVDCVAAAAFDVQSETRTISLQEVPQEWMVLDIGPASSLLFSEALQDAKTVIWNGPMGAFEMEPFSQGTMTMVRNLAESKALTVIGGGDTDMAVHKAGAASKMSYISTGGGAFLELLEGKKLPGVVALEECSAR
ncbi:MAG TPA: phosphoglycerate kinase [Thermodesulfobacteriota bacterium]|nr:phosphoglycerate kinase [Thermodesulfobacteriota bacterium]